MTESWRPAAWRGFAWGALAGLALVALMYLAGVFLGLKPLPQALSGPVLALMPGFVFGFLIDNLQHAGKVVEEFGLIVAMIVGLGALGAAWAVTGRRWSFAQSALVFAAIGWLVEAGWSLSVGGAVDKAMNLSLAELRALPSATEYVTLICISNNVGGDLISTGSFTGVRLRDLLAMASPRANGTWAAFKARDGYAESLPLSLINGAPEVLVAYDLDGAPLPNSHGFPARIVLPGHYGMKGPKWLDSIQLVDHESGGYWEMQGWDHNAVVKTTSRYDVPRDGDIVSLGTVSLSGVAFAGTRGVSKVEDSTDGGKSWTMADFKAPLSPLTWVLWSAAWTPGAEGSYELKVRATDGAGAVQEARDTPSYPSGAAGHHTIRISVSKS